MNEQRSASKIKSILNEKIVELLEIRLSNLYLFLKVNSQ